MGSLPEELTLELVRVIRALCTVNGTWNGDMTPREAQGILAKCTAHQENELDFKNSELALAASAAELPVLDKVVAE